MTITRSARALSITAVAVFALVASVLTFTPGAAQAADPTGSISGTVTRADGHPAEAIYARAFRLDDVDPTKRVQKGSGRVDASGSFRIAALPSGRYVVDYYAHDDGVIDEYWDDAPTVESARIIEVGAIEVTGIDAELAMNGLVSGTVTRPGGVPVSGVRVTLNKLSGDTWKTWDSAVTDDQGGYELYGSPGTFTIGFGDLAGELVGEWWPDQPERANAAAIALANGDHVIADAELSDGASISGRVTTSDGTSRAELTASVFQWESDPLDRWMHVRSAEVDENGEYRISGLHRGTYTVRFFGAPNVLPEWWGDKQREYEAERLDLDLDDDRTGIDAELTVLGTVTGTFTREDGVPIWAEALFYRQVTTDAGSSWILEGRTNPVYAQYAMHLPAGTYTVKFAPVGGFPTVRAEWWDDSREQAGAKSFELRLGETISGVSPIMNFLDPFPAATEAPRISGVPVVGSTLTAFPGVWPVHGYIAYEWLADGVPLTGETDETLVVPPAAVGKRITLSVRSWLSTYTPTSVASSPTDPVQPATLESSVPVVVGTPKVGGSVHVELGTWTAGTDFTVRWFADGVRLPVDVAWMWLDETYAGKRITATVTASKAGYRTLTLTSAPTAVVTGGVLVAGAPAISGLPAVGSTLTANPGTWTSGTTRTYQWFADGAAISGATKPTLTLASGVQGKAVFVKVTGTKAGFTTVTKKSAATLKIVAAPKPSIAGTKRVGYTLTAKAGTWTSGTTLTHQWYANGVALKGASASTLKLTSGLRGKTVTVKVTAKKAGYPAIARTSAATAKIL